MTVRKKGGVLTRWNSLEALQGTQIQRLASSFRARQNVSLRLPRSQAKGLSKLSREWNLEPDELVQKIVSDCLPWREPSGMAKRTSELLESELSHTMPSGPKRARGAEIHRSVQIESGRWNYATTSMAPVQHRAHHVSGRVVWHPTSPNRPSCMNLLRGIHVMDARPPGTMHGNAAGRGVTTCRTPPLL